MSVKDLTPENRAKVVDTHKYSLSQDESQDSSEVLTRCIKAILAEQYIAKEVDGTVAGGNEDHNDPWSYAFDVVASGEYSGLRIEVKTHQSNAKSISCHTGYSGDYQHGSGLNLGPFLNHKIADCMIILNCTEVRSGVYRFVPVILAASDAFNPKTGLVRKSNFSGWYIQPKIPDTNINYYQFTSI
ncbi:hypothetical protein fHeYen901_4 [Yersinia phage fHe-Yen9-01]|uniref:DNA endonuclease IV n=1 Tax=Yersinia phage fHe-Yen9-01 TaxID=1965363 RepID=A0A1V0DX99_9CAUD|nr:DenB-like DNA endonuclease IV [Yersinia phage fHe-Yen9-01]ARB05777.1 hypothetical protein fHeYen901_4 [Yersinia phage fHe-Yen9-01]